MKKKILFLISNLKIGGGAERVTSLLTNGLWRKFDIHILTLNDFNNLYQYNGKYYSLKENLGFFRKICGYLKINTIIRPIKIYLTIKRINPDLIISQMDYSNIFLIITKILFRINKPIILGVLTNPSMQYKKNDGYIRLLIKMLYSMSPVDYIITISRELKAILVNEYFISKDKIGTIYTGIRFDRINKLKNIDIQDKLNIFNDKNLIKFITMGRLIEEKGYSYLIDAFSKVINELPNSKLLIIGEGPLKTFLDQKIKHLSLDKSVKLLGIIKNPFNYIYQSDIFVLSSIHEGLPTVLLEALVCGIPIISTNCKTGPKEILDNGKYGILINTKDIDDLANNMISLAKNEKLMIKLSSMSIKRAHFFNFKKSINKWQNLIERMIKNYST